MNWYVITGGPSSGKSKLIDALSFRGFSVRPEAARIYIDEQMSRGLSLAQIRKDEQAFQLTVLQMKIAAEAAAEKKLSENLFWERGIPDSIAYLEQCGADAETARKASIRGYYKQIFLLDRPPPYEFDYARTESESQAAQIHDRLRRTYEELGYEVIVVPVLPISERADFILKGI